MHVRKLILAGSGLAVLGAPFATIQSAHAQETAEQAEEQSYPNEIIVQARKRAERLIDIPETIAAISADTIQDAGIASLEDVGRQTPNIVLNRRQDNEPNVVIRGVGGFGNTQGVGFYVDDVQNFTDQSASIEDVERIEILKGPQGTLYGGSNIGGAIKYVLKRPTDRFGGEARIEYGSFDTINAFGAVNLPVGENFSTRVSGYYNHTRGFVANTFLGGYADQSTEWGTRIAIGWQPTDNLDIQLSYRHNELANGGNVYTTATERPDGSAIYRRTIELNTDVENRKRVDGVIFNLAYDMGPVEFTNVTSYTRRKVNFAWDLDYSAADAVVAFSTDRNTAKVFTQELRLASTGTTDFDWLLGAYYSSVADRGITNSADLYLGPDAGGPLFVADFNNGDSIEKQYALFGTANYRLGDFRIGAGVRVGRVEFKGTDRNIPITVPVNETVVLPKITLSYDVAPDVMIYANYALGTEPGRVNLVSGTAGAYRSEKASAIEAGIKGTVLDRTLTFEFASYYIDYKRRQFETQIVLPNGAITEEVSNIGRSVSYGVEGGLTYRPIDGLTLAGSAGYLNSKWKDKDALYFFQPVDGLTVPNAPEFTANVSIDYKIPVGSDLELGLRADYNHVSKFYWNIRNTANQPAYDLVNLRASIGDPDGRWEFAVRAENLFNQKYFNELTPDVFTVGEALAVPGAPARVMASFSFKM